MIHIQCLRVVNQGKEEDYISVSVIVNDSSSERWDAFREGLEQGAEDNHVHLNLVSTGKFQNVQEEQTIGKKRAGRKCRRGDRGTLFQ